MSDSDTSTRAKRRTLLLLSGLAVGMFGFGFAMVPLYGLLCQVTGVQSVDQRLSGIGNGSSTNAASVVAQASLADRPRTHSGQPLAQTHWVTVKLDATVHPDLPWSLTPMQRRLRVHPGESHRVVFLAENRSGHEITAQAIPSIAPWRATDFFAKLECFCFTQQTLTGSEVKEMPLQFTISPDLPEGIDSLTLSYSVLRVSAPEPFVAR